MARWDEKYWESFYWDAGIDSEIDKKIGTYPILRVQLTTSGTTTDVTDHLIGGANIDVEKSRYPDSTSIVAAGDVSLVFSNYDDLFTELSASSIFYGVTYIGYSIDIDFGLRLEDGTIAYQDQITLKMVDVNLSSDNSQCSITCRDTLYELIDFTLNTKPTTLNPIVGGANVGNGYITGIDTKPFLTETENWVMTCTTSGGSGVAIFSVVGSVSGNIGNATSNTQFYTNAAGGVKFTISAGGTNWNIGDTFSFSTRVYPEWTNINPVKIIWSVLTGYNYDTDVQESWYDYTPKLDHTQSSANTDISFATFQTGVANLTSINNLTGYLDYNQNLSEFLETILVHFLGHIYVDGTGLLNLQTYTMPTFGASEPSMRVFSSSKKIVSLRYKKSLEDIINNCTARYKGSIDWAWSNETENKDGTVIVKDATSITTYGEKIYEIDTIWYSSGGLAIQWAANRLVSKYANPILEVEFVTGIDALKTVLGDIIKVTDAKTQLSEKKMEVYHISKDFSGKPIHFTINCDDADSDVESKKWCFLGSDSDEGDGISPQAADYDSATDSDKQFCYLSTTGSGSEPLYYLW